MAFKLTLTSNDDGISHVAAHGEATAKDLPLDQIAHFESLLGPKWASYAVALNMEAVPYLDSSAIGWLIGAQKSFRASGGNLVMHSVQSSVRNILSLLKIERIVPIAQTAADARTLLQPPPPPAEPEPAPKKKSRKAAAS